MMATTSNRAQWTADEIATLTRLYPITPALVSVTATGTADRSQPGFVVHRLG